MSLPSIVSESVPSGSSYGQEDGQENGQDNGQRNGQEKEQENEQENGEGTSKYLINNRHIRCIT